MPFNNDKSGFQNEFDFIKQINRKKFGELNPLFQMFLSDLYDGEVKPDDFIYAWKNISNQKSDFLIRLAHQRTVKRISVKKGFKNSVHVEPVMEFVHFLIENQVPKNIVIKYLEYHFADGTINGSGTNRMSVDEYKLKHQKEIDYINYFLNREELLKKAIDRFIIKGKNLEDNVDMILYGVPDDFLWLTRKDVYNVILSNKNIYSTSVHFSNLTCQPLTRALNGNPKLDKKRYYIQIKWYNLIDDIIWNMNNNFLSNNV